MKKSPAAVADIKQALEAFLVLGYRRVVAADHAKTVMVDDLARELKVPAELAERVAGFLEREGLLDYDDQAVDITIPGMLRAEALLRGERDGAARPDKPARSAPVARRAPRRKRT